MTLFHFVVSKKQCWAYDYKKLASNDREMNQKDATTEFVAVSFQEIRRAAKES